MLQPVRKTQMISRKRVVFNFFTFLKKVGTKEMNQNQKLYCFSLGPTVTIEIKLFNIIK